MKADTVLAEENGGALAQADGHLCHQEERTQDDEPEDGANDVREPLDCETQLMPWSKTRERITNPSKLFFEDIGKRDGNGIDRLANRFALVRGRPSHGVEAAQRFGLQADRHLVDDIRMEDLLDLGDGAGNPAFSRRRPLWKSSAAVRRLLVERRAAAGRGGSSLPKSMTMGSERLGCPR
jgi:hypothetical protein